MVSMSYSPAYQITIKFILMLGIMILQPAEAVAAHPRLALWITAPIGPTNGAHCKVAPSPPISSLFESPPTLTENDVINWNEQDGRWSLDTSKISLSKAKNKIQDHCFVLVIDDSLVSSGLILSSYSARLTSLPTISVTFHEKSVDMLLTIGFPNKKPIHANLFNAVFNQRSKTQAISHPAIPHWI